MPGTFAAYRLARLRPPLNGPQGETWANVLGGIQDQELALLRVAALSRFPATCPDDGLDLLGQAFDLGRFPGESNDAYRARLAAAWPTYDIAGSAQAIVASLQAYGFVDVLVLPVWQAPAPFLPESSSTSYSEFYVFLGPDMGTTGILPLILGSWTLGSSPGSTLGSSATVAQITAAKRQILRWKAAHGLPIRVFLLFGSQSASAAPALCQYQIGRCLGDTLTILGSPGFVLGGYYL